jgi:hypothetical protein
MAGLSSPVIKAISSDPMATKVHCKRSESPGRRATTKPPSEDDQEEDRVCPDAVGSDNRSDVVKMEQISMKN